MVRKVSMSRARATTVSVRVPNRMRTHLKDHDPTDRNQNWTVRHALERGAPQSGAREPARAEESMQVFELHSAGGSEASCETVHHVMFVRCI